MVLVALVVAGQLPIIAAGQLPIIAGCQLIKLSTKEPGNIPAIFGGRPATTCAASTISGSNVEKEAGARWQPEPGQCLYSMFVYGNQLDND